MLPPELVESVCHDLNLETVVALSQAKLRLMGEVPETVFRSKLKAVCPWFEPQSSHRNTWRECAVEFVRRRKGGRFVTSLEVVNDCDEELVLSKKKKFFECPELVDIFTKSTFTSSHGITMDVSSLKWRGFGGTTHHVGAIDHNLVSLPDLLMLDLCHSQGCCQPEFNIYVKLRDSPGIQPDYVSEPLYGSEKPQVYILDTSVFLLSCDYGTCAQRGKNIRKSSLYFIDEDGIHEIDLGEVYTPVMAVFDGLFHILRNNRYYCLQCSLDEPAIVDSIPTGLFVTDSFREDTWSPYLSVSRSDEHSYLFDVSKRQIVAVEEDEERVFVSAGARASQCYKNSCISQ